MTFRPEAANDSPAALTVRRAEDRRDGPDLRIPAGATARGPDIPLVPVPPPPLGRDRSSRPASPAPPPAKPAATAPASAPAAPQPTETAAPTPGELVRQAMVRYATIDSYIARLTRREVVKNKRQPEEVLLFKFRKEPWSVYFKWLGKQGQGREAVYVPGRYGGKIHTLLAAGDMPLVPAGRRMAVSPDNVFVRSASRHPISEAGIGASVERLNALVRALDRGNRQGGTLKVLAGLNRPEFEKSVNALEHAIPAGAEEAVPRGGRRLYFFDPDSHLPVLVIGYDHRGEEVEYYRYDRLLYPVKLNADDFDPDKLWPAPKPKP
jgi:hypothetical protein